MVVSADNSAVNLMAMVEAHAVHGFILATTLTALVRLFADDVANSYRAIKRSTRKEDKGE